MPRVSKQQAALNRRAITGAAATLIKERGLDRVSVAEAMAGAGLTHGGFYGHFGSKDDLVAEACRAAFANSVERWKKRAAEARDPREARARLIDAYVSKASRNSPGSSCPATALAVDVAREPETAAIRAEYAGGVSALIDVLAGLEPPIEARLARREALADFCLMVGSVVLARATLGEPLSDELLEAARARLKESTENAG